eukprot:2032431-Rhodomonas_salina.1
MCGQQVRAHQACEELVLPDAPPLLLHHLDPLPSVGSPAAGLPHALVSTEDPDPTPKHRIPDPTRETRDARR